MIIAPVRGVEERNKLVPNPIPAAKLSNGRVPLNILELAPLSTGMTRKEALDTSLNLAKNADRLGYNRLWVAEHHGSQVFMCSASSVIITRALENTTRLRVGAGGVMLPNWAPLTVAETYGTLYTIYEGRVDLGLGRAPGTDPATARALHRGSSEPAYFEEDLEELASYLSDQKSVVHSGVVSGAEASILGIEVIGVDRPFTRVRAIPGEGTAIPMWMLSSSSAGAKVAADLGMPYVFAGHFAPYNVDEAIEIYRREFNAKSPTAMVDHPVVMMGMNVMCNEDEAEAKYQFTTTQQVQGNVLSGRPGTLTPPTDDLDATLGEKLADRVRALPSIHAVGTPEQVVEKMDWVSRKYMVDEIITVTHAYDPEVRIHSLELVAKAWGLPILPAEGEAEEAEQTPPTPEPEVVEIGEEEPEEKVAPRPGASRNRSAVYGPVHRSERKKPALKNSGAANSGAASSASEDASAKANASKAAPGKKPAAKKPAATKKPAARKTAAKTSTKAAAKPKPAAKSDAASEQATPAAKPTARTRTRRKPRPRS